MQYLVNNLQGHHERCPKREQLDKKTCKCHRLQEIPRILDYEAYNNYAMTDNQTYMYFISATCFGLKVGHHRAIQTVQNIKGDTYKLPYWN